MFAQYRFAIVWAAPVGAIITTVVVGLFVIGGIATNGSGVAWASVLLSVVAYAAIGAAIGLVGLLGGMLTVWLADRRSDAPPRVWVYGGSIGASAAVGVLWLLVAGGIAINSGGWVFLGMALMPGILAVIVACIAATALLDRCKVRFDRERERGVHDGEVDDNEALPSP